MLNRWSLPPSLLGLLAVLLVPGCNVTNCENLRDELFAEKLKWQACESDDDCIKVGGSGQDCTGILSCDLALNRRYRAEADRRIASLPEETADCMACQSPNCVEGDVALCERVTRQCIIVTEIIARQPASAPEPP